jgi:predicted transposase YdaD
LAKPFDSTTKDLLEKNPRAWLEFFLGRKLAAVRVVDADLSTITLEADKVFRVGGKHPWMVHVELVSSRAPDLLLRIQRYNILIRYRHNLPVQTVVVLLRPKADEPGLSGVFEDHLPGGVLYHSFRYNVVRLWERPVEEILAGNMATLPIAPLARVSPSDLPRVIRVMEQRFENEAKPHEIAELWAATYILMGLIYPEAITMALLQGVRKMRDSVTYQAILREGKAEGKVEGKAEGKVEGKAEGQLEEAKRLVLRLGRKKLGPPSSAIKAKIGATGDLIRLERLSDRILDAKSWDELISGA